MLVLAAVRDWDFEQMDVFTVFFYGELEEDIYMDQFEGFVDSEYSDWVCKFKKILYGLK